jgi:hypothetical protein
MMVNFRPRPSDCSLIVLSDRPKRPAVGGTSMVLHATPRLPVDDVERTPSGRVERERRLEVLVYHRMLLCVWRRSKARLAMVSESLRRRQDQVCHPTIHN